MMIINTLWCSVVFAGEAADRADGSPLAGSVVDAAMTPRRKARIATAVAALNPVLSICVAGGCDAERAKAGWL